MIWFLLIGIFCVLAVIGFFITGRPFAFAIGGIVFLIAIVFISLIVIVVWSTNSPCTAPFADHSSTYCRNQTVSTSVSNNSAQPSSNISQQTPETSSDPFPMNDSSTQYTWYDNHNVPMAFRCYPGSNCSAQDWAYAVYNDKSDSRGTALKQQADAVQAAYISGFPAEKCVTESGVKICDLSHSVKQTFGDGTRDVSFQANAIDCVNVVTGKQTQNQGNTVQVDSSNTYCASDLGAVYIDPTIQVEKYFGSITENADSLYQVPSTYETCIWTYEGGSGAIPNVEVSNNIGPSDSYYDVEAFCKNGSNQVDIYSYKN